MLWSYATQTLDNSLQLVKVLASNVSGLCAAGAEVKAMERAAALKFEGWGKVSAAQSVVGMLLRPLLTSLTHTLSTARPEMSARLLHRLTQVSQQIAELEAPFRAAAMAYILVHRVMLSCGLV